jgi:hypothetical protein
MNVTNRQAALCSIPDNLYKIAPKFTLKKWRAWKATASAQELLAIWPLMWWRFAEIRADAPVPDNIRLGPVSTLTEPEQEAILLSLGFEPWAAHHCTQYPESRYDDKRTR